MGAEARRTWVGKEMAMEIDSRIRYGGEAGGSPQGSEEWMEMTQLPGVGDGRIL